MNWRDFLDAFLTPKPKPTPPPLPTTREVSVVVTAGARGELQTDGGTFRATADPFGILLFTLPLTVTGGAGLFLTLEGYDPWYGHVVLDPTLHDPIRMTRTVVVVIPEPEPPILITPDPPDPVRPDAIVLADARIASRDCPDVRGWPVFTPLRRVTLADHQAFERGDTMVEFDGRDELPPAYGTQGKISYTLWLGCFIQRVWYLLPIVECIGGYVPTGQLLEPGHLAANLLYFADPPLRGYQPAHGEPVIMFCTTGDTRRQNAQAPGVTPGRTTALTVRWQVGVTMGAI